MNTKPTKKKVIWSLVIALSINAIVPLVNWLITTITWPLMQKYLETNKLTGLFGPAILSTLTSYMLSADNILIFILEFIIIYLLWSLFQRKSNYRRSIRKRNR